MELDEDAVRSVGNKDFPAVGEVFRETGDKISSAKLDVDIGPESPDYNQVNLVESANDFIWCIADFLTTSADYLDDCGSTLVKLVDEHALLDQDSADEIYASSYGFDDDDRHHPDDPYGGKSEDGRSYGEILEGL